MTHHKKITNSRIITSDLAIPYLYVFIGISVKNVEKYPFDMFDISL